MHKFSASQTYFRGVSCNLCVVSEILELDFARKEASQKNQLHSQPVRTGYSALTTLSSYSRARLTYPSNPTQNNLDTHAHFRIVRARRSFLPTTPMSSLKRARGPLLIIGASALGGAVYRSYSTSPSSSASLNPHDFTPYTLVSKQPVSSTSAIFTLRNENSTVEADSVKEVWKRSIWSVQIKQPQLQIARAYTPLPPNLSPKHDGKSQDLRLLIRQEEGGEVSTYLHRLPENATMEIRGPNTEVDLPRDIIEVVFLAGGTGIAPAMQVAQALGRRTKSQMHILWANRKREECEGGVSDERPSVAQERTGLWKSLFGGSEAAPQTPLVDEQGDVKRGLIVQELEKLKKRSEAGTRGLKVQYYVDEEKTFIQPDDVVRRIKKTNEEAGSKLIIVSGPDGFIDYWAGKKVWAGGREVQGPLGGQLSKMDLGGWKVVKL